MSLGFFLGACGDESRRGGGAFFPADLEGRGYALVRACRAPGEHSALAGYTVWVNPESESAYRALFAGDASTMPPGTIVVKEVFSTTSCEPGTLDHWAAMKKEPGFDPENGDWRYQEVDAVGVREDGAVESCIACHRGGDDTSCTGFGAVNGKDYLCTAP